MRVARLIASSAAALVAIATASAQTPSFTMKSYPAPKSYHMRSADLNNDGYPDLLLYGTDIPGPNYSYLGTSLSVMLNDGHGGFLPAQALDTNGTTTTYAAVADLNGDGLQDVVACAVVPNSSNNVNVWINQGGGKFKLGDSFWAPLGCASIVLADANRDGKPDIILATRDSGEKNELSNVITTYFNDGTGKFPISQQQSVGVDGSRPNQLCGIADAVGADFNGDGNPDLFLTVVCQALNNATNEYVAMGDGKGNYTLTEIAESAANNAANNAYVADVNGDGKPDVILVSLYQPANSNASTGTLEFLLDNGKTPSNGVQVYQVTSNSASYKDTVIAGAAGKFNADPIPDAVFAYTQGGAPRLAIRYATDNKGDYGSPVNLANPAGMPLWIVSGNFNKGALDGFAVLEQGSNGDNVVVYTNNGTGNACTAPASAGVNVCSPAEGADVTSPVNFVAAGTGATGTVNHLELWIDGKKIANYFSSSINVDVAVANGSHSATVIEVDSAGGYVKSSPVRFTVGASASCQPPSAPGAMICMPSAGSSVSTPVAFTGAGTASSGTVNHLELWVDGKKVGNYSGDTMSTSVALPAGSHSATLVEVDSTGSYLKSSPVGFTVK